MKMLVTALALSVLPGLALAEGCNWMKDSAASCAQGFTWDSEARACVKVTTS